MGARTHIVAGGSRRSLAAIALVVASATVCAHAQQNVQGPAQMAVPAPAAEKTQAPIANEASQQVTLDTVVAIVNGDLILQSDVDAEERFAAFQPFSDPKPMTHMTQDELIDRLINRTLILQQMALQPSVPITDEEVDSELNTLRKALPKCAAYHCETDAGWKKFVEDQGFTMEELRERWRQRMEVLQFIEERFRMGIRILPEEIDDYYKTTMLPTYAKDGVQAPPEATISDRIQEILLQQRVDKLLDDWLTALRAEGSVRVLKPGEEVP